MSSRLGPKLETALIAWLTANKGARLSGLNLRPAHAATEPTPPYLSCWVARAPVHPDFQSLPGSNWPQRAQMEVWIRAHCTDASHAAGPAQWASEVVDILANSRLVGAFTAATNDTCTLATHGLSDGQLVQVESTTTLPGGLSASTNYYLIATATNTFKLSLTAGGAAVDITSTGTGTHYLVARTAQGSDFSQFITGCNSGGSVHPSDGLLVESVTFIDEISSAEGNHWIYGLVLEIDAQNGDPVP